MGKNKGSLYYHKMKNHSGCSALDIARVKKIAEEETEKMQVAVYADAIADVLAISVEVLATCFWEKTAKKKCAEFSEQFVSLLESLQMGVVSREQLAQDLDYYAGIKFDDSWMRKAGDYYARRRIQQGDSSESGGVSAL